MVKRTSGTTGRKPTNTTKAQPKKVAEPVEPKCGTCIYFRQVSTMFANCQRYPQAITVNASNWCGEYKENGSENGSN